MPPSDCAPSACSFDRTRPPDAPPAQWDAEVGKAVHEMLGRVLTVKPQSSEELVRDLHSVEATARAQVRRWVPCGGSIHRARVAPCMVTLAWEPVRVGCAYGSETLNEKHWMSVWARRE